MILINDSVILNLLYFVLCIKYNASIKLIVFQYYYLFEYIRLL